MKRENKYYLRIRRFTVIIILVIISSPKIYSQAQEQGLPTDGKTNLCTPHTNKTVDSPSTPAWAKLSAPNDSASHHAELGALQKFTSVTHEEIYIKVDAVVLIKNSSLSSEFIINPGAEMHHIMLTYNRARNIKINNSKELVHDGEFRRFVMNEPVAYQMIEGNNIVINTDYEIDNDSIVSFDIDDYNKELPLIIVPSISEINDFADYNAKYFDNSIGTEMAKLE